MTRMYTSSKLKWSRVPSPGKMSGGNIWKAESRGWSFAIAKAHGQYYLTGAYGFLAEPSSLGVFDRLFNAQLKADELAST